MPSPDAIGGAPTARVGHAATMPRPLQAAAVAAAGLLGAVGLAACGGGSASSASSSVPTAASPTSPTSPPATTGSPSPTARASTSDDLDLTGVGTCALLTPATLAHHDL